MMEDDLISCLTRQVQEDVIENYLRERRLIDEQINYVEELARKTLKKAEKTGRRFSRMGYLLVDEAFRNLWAEMVGLSKDSFWYRSLTEEYKGNTRFIRVTALTHKGRFKRLVLEAYKRLLQRMEEYDIVYQNLKQEVEAVNINIKNFHNNFDLLAIVQFLKSMDVCMLERKKFLGENFSPEELISIDRKMYFKPVAIEKWEIPLPMLLPAFGVLEHRLERLAEDVYARFGWRLKQIVR